MSSAQFYETGASAVMEDLSQFGGINLTDLFDVDEICKGKKEAADGGAGGSGADDESKLRDLLMSLS